MRGPLSRPKNGHRGGLLCAGSRQLPREHRREHVPLVERTWRHPLAHRRDLRRERARHRCRPDAQPHPRVRPAGCGLLRATSEQAACADRAGGSAATTAATTASTTELSVSRSCSAGRRGRRPRLGRPCPSRSRRSRCSNPRSSARSRFQPRARRHRGGSGRRRLRRPRLWWRAASADTLSERVRAGRLAVTSSNFRSCTLGRPAKLAFER